VKLFRPEKLELLEIPLWHTALHLASATKVQVQCQLFICEVIIRRIFRT